MRRTIYLDTVLWNKLYEESVDPTNLVTSLRSNGAELVLSPHLRYEMSKTFRSTRPGRKEKAIFLFTYLERFLDLEILCVKQVVDLLREEVKSADSRVREVERFYRNGEYEREIKEIRKLARGEVDAGTDRVLDFRGTQVGEFRRESPRRAAMWANRMGGKRASFTEFLEFGLRELAPDCLRRHVSDLFPDFRPKDLKRIARKILSAPRFRLAHALVRGDLYLDWRCFCGRPVARDTADDCYHIENAAYCDIYATGDRSQKEYANEILPATSVRIYEGRKQPGEWLNSIGKSE